MKLADLQRVCEHRWECNQADLISLDLTDDSYDELWTDLMLNPGSPCSYKFYPGILHNPVTRTKIVVNAGAEQDSAHFHRRGSTCGCYKGENHLPVFLSRRRDERA